MLGSNSELVVLPLVARFVQTVDAAVNASKSEGADFLIYGGGDLKRLNQEIGNVVENVKIPIFASCVGKNMSYAEASSLLASGASGFVTGLESFGLFDDDFLYKLFDGAIANDERILDDRGSKIDVDKSVNKSNGLQSKIEIVGGFVKLEDREKQLIEMER
ncbi:GTP-binding protein engA, partial [Trifolium medium]|nr:GTP-binding protein engA [Trifolium medium]